MWKRRGFTLVEVLILLLVIAILASTVIPHLLGAGRAANEARLPVNLRELRHAIGKFRIDTGGHPDKLEHLMRSEPPNKMRLWPDGAECPVSEDDFRGPYMWTPDGELPIDIMTGKRHWRYDNKTGMVWSDSDAIALDGTPYSTW